MRDLTNEELQKIIAGIRGRQKVISDKLLEEEAANIKHGVNTWTYIFADIVGMDNEVLLRRIITQGLQDTIREAQDAAMDIQTYLSTCKPTAKKVLLSNKKGESPLCEYYNDYYHYIQNSFWSVVLCRDHSVVDVEKALLLLKFPKRLKLPTLDIASQMWADFKRNNTERRYWPYTTSLTKNEQKRYDSPLPANEYEALTYRCLSETITKELAEIMHVLVNGYKRDEGLLTLPPGKTAEGLSNYLDKSIYVFGRQAQWLRDHGVQVPFSTPAFWKFTNRDTATHHDWEVNEKPDDWGEYGVVPKDATRGRGIMKEPVARQTFAYQVDSGLGRTWSSHRIMFVEDQSVNQLFALLGSYDVGTFATDDFSAASDSLSIWLEAELLRYDPELWEDLLVARSSYIRYKNDRIQSHLLATMGNAITFKMEGNTFAVPALWCVIKYAIWHQAPGKETVIEGFEYIQSSVKSMLDKLERYEPEWYQSFSKHAKEAVKRIDGKIPSRRKTKNWTMKDWVWWAAPYVHIHGDDTIIPCCVQETFAELCVKLGLKLNTTKSYSTGIYRESCGLEAIDGYPFHLDIYPRGTSSFKLAELISLQHKLVEISPRANFYLEDAIRSIKPSITSSGIGCDHFDIWDPYYQRTPVKASHYGAFTQLRFVEITPLGRKFQQYLDTDSLSERVRLFGKLLSDEQFNWMLERFQNLEPPCFRLDALQNEGYSQRGWEITECTVNDEKELTRLRFRPCIYIPELPKDKVISELLAKRDTNIEVIEYLKTHEVNEDLCRHHTLKVRHSTAAKNELIVCSEQVDFAMYYLSLGGGIEHINKNPYSSLEKQVRNPLDFLETGEPYVTIGYSFD